MKACRHRWCPRRMVPADGTQRTTRRGGGNGNASAWLSALFGGFHRPLKRKHVHWQLLEKLVGCFHRAHFLLSPSRFKSFQRNSKANSDKPVIRVIVLLSRRSLTHQRRQRSAHGPFLFKNQHLFSFENLQQSR